VRKAFDSLTELAGLIKGRTASSRPPPSWFAGTRETWDRLCRMVVPVDSKAIWLAAYAPLELASSPSRRIDDSKYLARHLRLQSIATVFEDLAWIRARQPKQLAAYRSSEEQEKLSFFAAWEAWGLKLPHPLPLALLQARLTTFPFAASRTMFPSSSDVQRRLADPLEGFQSFVRYLTLVGTPPLGCAATYDLCIAIAP